MWIGVISLFPEMFEAIEGSGITRRAIEGDLLELRIWNPRDFATDKHRTVDDKPYGGGAGMLMKVAPLKAAIEAAKAEAGEHAKVICLSPQGTPLTQAKLEEYAGSRELILVAGRYEGIDERLMKSVIDEEVSIGDYVLSGGELPAMVLIDGITRLLPGAVGDRESVEQDSFSSGLLDFPQYTRPETVDGLEVPEVLMSGDHEKIARWRKMQALGRTFERRPDLIDQQLLTDKEKQLLNEYLALGETKGT
ncbi:MAG: tRNA (guanosine(37)-N1)-methyltransferase TrmD [Pseudomonadales bacterium]|nr:tRNA (guanosine(37)-N1)-methyltransferase TrmD [Pseudomonadales bacterium]MBO6596326.1 tRNA (guanosine(37)-N1)-methyltransferase TrmD [Pseudomonadales bacterium]MBO6822806.1 tRNA (guanosine(37)-N1)-methyltransferase TrmD [Pseudomonadales bacterium]